MPQGRAYRIAYYAVPMLFCLAVHWVAIKTWFSADDFAWLGLPLELHANVHDWLDVFFGPRAQGTVRTLSERVYFVVFTSIFGLNALPFRLWAFLTQLGNLILISKITRRITGSELAGFLAPILWTANAGLAIALDWSSSYNELCCAFFLLLAFYLLLRYIDTGESKYWTRQWVVFLLGFGALELIVMYPPIAALYTWLFARQYFRRTLWLFVPSAAFTVVHALLIPKTHDPNYTMHFDLGVLSTLWKYWAFATGAWRPELIDWRPVWLGLAMGAAVLCGAVFLLIKNSRLVLFCLAWFALVITPVLPLANHFTEYYVTIPAIGLAILGGWALTRYPVVAGALAVVYLAAAISDIYIADRYFYERARRTKRMVQGLEARRESYAGKLVLVGGIDNDLFWTAFFDDPFRLMGITDIYLLPGSESAIQPHPEWGSIDRFIISLDKAVGALEKNRAEVFAMHGDRLDDVTASYRDIAIGQYIAAHRDFVDVGNPAYEKLLGEGWHRIEDGYRWMGKTASVQLSGPKTAGERVYVKGYCPRTVVAEKPVELTVRVDGVKIGSLVLSKPDQAFEADFPAPAAALGKYTTTVTVEVNRTTKIGSDVRELGLIFGTFRMK